MSLLSVLAPHNLRPLTERIGFHTSLEHVLETNRNRATYGFGDFNARMGHRRPGEEDILGEYCFGREAQHAVELPNRDLVIELCTNFTYIIANTWIANPDDRLVTYHEPCAPPMSEISVEHFTILALVLCPAEHANRVLSLCSDRLGCIASHHFLVTATLDVCAAALMSRICSLQVSPAGSEPGPAGGLGQPLVLGWLPAEDAVVKATHLKLTPC